MNCARANISFDAPRPCSHSSSMFRKLLLLVAWAGLVGSASSATNGVSFGYAGPETFPIDQAITQLRSADIDGDGLMDLIVVNNARARINILYNQTGKTNASVPRHAQREMNELPPDARFRIESVASEKRIAGFTVADVNHDQRPDF